MNKSLRPPWFLRGAHRQTLVGHLLPGTRIGQPDRRYFVPLPDGDTLVLHENLPRKWVPGGPMVLLIHGLTGSHDSGTIRRLAHQLCGANIACQRLDMRGAGDGFALAKKSYNGGCSEDLDAAISHISKIHPGSQLGVMGVSLGANVALRLAGVLGEEAHTRFPNWCGLVAMNPPVDLGACSRLLALPQNRLYESTFLKALWKSETHRRVLLGKSSLHSGPGPTTLRQFDDMVTAPSWGFANADAYYEWGSSIKLLPNVRVPGWVLTARDDPFVDHRPLEALAPKTGALTIDIHDHGGHMGYLTWNRGFHRWAEPEMVGQMGQFLTK